MMILGNSPWAAWSANRKSACSVLVGRPVAGPALCQRIMTGPGASELRLFLTIQVLRPSARILDLRSRLTNADRRERHPSPCLLLISHPLPVPRSCCSPADETQDTHSRLWRGGIGSRVWTHNPASTFPL